MLSSDCRDVCSGELSLLSSDYRAVCRGELSLLSSDYKAVCRDELSLLSSNCKAVCRGELSLLSSDCRAVCRGELSLLSSDCRPPCPLLVVVVVVRGCQLTEPKRTKDWERYPNRFRHIYQVLLPENVGKHCLKWPGGKTESEIKFLIQENSKPQDLIVYTDDPVTKDLSQCGFTVKQGATTIHEIYAAYTVSISSLTMKAEAVTQACKNEALDDLPRKYV